MKSSLLFTLSIGLTWLASKSIAQESTTEPTSRVVLASEVEWEPLNPARGDKSPKAATLWGDRNGAGQTGFLVKFVDGFKSPPHIHNVTYRGVVISGLIHNDDPGAREMWMPAGSFWTQPAGEAHTTAAKGSDNMAFIEIDGGPYLVLPTEEALDSGESPVNMEASNIVWLGASNTTWIEKLASQASDNEPKVAFLWGNPKGDQPYGALVKLPAGFTAKIRCHSSTLHAVVIQGRPKLQMQGETNVKPITAGSYFSSKGKSLHQVWSDAGEESIMYFRMDSKFDVIPVQSKK